VLDGAADREDLSPDREAEREPAAVAATAGGEDPPPDGSRS
jgi:hypothetical protein